MKRLVWLLLALAACGGAQAPKPLPQGLGSPEYETPRAFEPPGAAASATPSAAPKAAPAPAPAPAPPPH